jgi:PhnB protein
MQFYQGIFGGELEIMSIGSSQVKDQFPEEIHQQTLHASLANGNFFLMASDTCGQGDVMQGNSFQFNLNYNSKEEIKSLFQQLSKGGSVVQELEEQFWGDLFAMVIDKFGVRWMLSLEQKKE